MPLQVQLTAAVCDSADARLEGLEQWKNSLHIHRVSDVFDYPNDDFFTLSDIHPHIKASIPRHLTRREKRAWKTRRLQDWPLLKNEIPRAIKTPARNPPTIQDQEIVYATRGKTKFYARYQTSVNGNSLAELFLDHSRLPHLTGKIIRLTHKYNLTRVALWTQPNKRYTRPYAGDVVDDPIPEFTSAVIGPVTTAFPLNTGWKPALAPDPSNGKVPCLSDLTIHEITTILTRVITKDIRPNCEDNWWDYWLAAFSSPYFPPWLLIWLSQGTPLSDPTEEKAWRKLLHRAINAKNRHPKNPDHTCWLHCGARSESIFHNPHA